MKPYFDTHQFATSVTDDSTSSSQSSFGVDDNENSSVIDQQILATTTLPKTRGTLQSFTLRHSVNFDRCTVTDRNGVYMAVAEAFEYT